MVGGFAAPQYVGVALLVVFVNLAFFGISWHAGRMVLTPPATSIARGEASAWMVGAMLACLVLVVALGLHVPGDLTRLLSAASRGLAQP